MQAGSAIVYGLRMSSSESKLRVVDHSLTMIGCAQR
jgi:hypothetical protein